MIRVTVDLIPGGLGEPETLATVVIANDGRKGPYARSRLADYRVRVHGRAGQHLPDRDARVEDHRRLTSPILTLVRKALEEAGY